jgi:hypothetical protein
MSDTPPILYGGLTAAEYTSARTAWANAGHSVESFDRQLGVSSAPVISAAPAKQPPPAYQLDTGGSNLTPGQVAAAVKSLTAAGANPQKIADALAADRLAAPEVDERTPEQAEHDRAWLAGPYTPEMYPALDWRELPGHMQKQTIEQRAEIDRDFRQYAADLRLPPALGTSFMEQALRVGAEMRALSAADLAVWKANGSAEIAAMYKTQEEWDAAADNIRALLDRAGKDHPISAVLKTGHLCSPWLWITLATQAEHLVSWAASRPEKRK